MIGADRINDGLSSEGLAVQLTTRFSPALDLIRNMNPMHYFVGLGAGTPFEIPWFEYRGLDDKNSNIDSAYLTYFVKYGVIGLYLLFVFTTSITHHLKNPGCGINSHLSGADVHRVSHALSAVRYRNRL